MSDGAKQIGVTVVQPGEGDYVGHPRRIRELLPRTW